jgi:hypothetical protein
MGDELKLAAAMHRVFTSWQPKFLMASPTDLEMKPSWSRRKIVAQGRVDADTCAKNMAFLDLGDRRPSRHLTRMWGVPLYLLPLPFPFPFPFSHTQGVCGAYYVRYLKGLPVSIT